MTIILPIMGGVKVNLSEAPTQYLEYYNVTTVTTKLLVY